VALEKGLRKSVGTIVRKIKTYCKRVKGEGKRRKAAWTGHVLGRKCLLNHVIEAQIEKAGR
jgi:hypothetical protein